MPIKFGLGRNAIRSQIPMSLLNEKHAMRNHSQTLERLAERGGLSPCEALAIIEKRDHRFLDPKETLTKLKGLF